MSWLSNYFDNYYRSLDKQRTGTLDAYVDWYHGNPVAEEMEYFDSLGWNGTDFGPSDSTVTTQYGDKSTYIPMTNSGVGVNNGSFTVNSGSSDFDRYLQSIKEISDANTAKSIELANAQNAWQAEQNKIAMDFNASEAAKLRDWNEYMSSTAHQREVKDLIEAGLNPVLSAGGNGASIGSAQAAQGVTSSGARGSVDNTYASAALSQLNHIMDQATKIAVAQASGSARSYADDLWARTVYQQDNANYRAQLQAETSRLNALQSNNNWWNIGARYANGLAKAYGYDSWPDAVAGLTRTWLYGKRANYSSF